MNTWSSAAAPTLEQLAELARKLEAARPPRYRIVREHGLTQWIAVDGRLFTTRRFAEGIVERFPNLAAPDPFAGHLSGLMLFCVSQEELEDLAARIAPGHVHP